MLNLLDLSFHSIIDDIYGARDVKLTPEEIVVLSLRNPCVSIYSYSHQLIREIIPFGKNSFLILIVNVNCYIWSGRLNRRSE